MKGIFGLMVVFLCNTSFAQKAGMSNCSCSFTFSISYPKKAEENKISGTVIIEFDRDTACVLSHPIVIKNLGYGCVEEALRLAKQKANASMKCSLKCPGEKCSIGKIKWPISFQYIPE